MTTITPAGVTETQVIEIGSHSHLEAMTSLKLDRYIVKRVGIDAALAQRVQHNWNELGPALLEMERRYDKKPGARTDLADLAVPGWHEYLLSRGLNPSTYRVWKHRSRGDGGATTKVVASQAQSTAARNLADAKAQLGAAAESGNEQAAAIIAEYEAACTVTVEPVALVTPPDANVIIVELTRDLENRLAKLAVVVEQSAGLNPTLITKFLTVHKNYAAAAASLLASMPTPSDDGKCHQRVVRERMAALDEPDLEAKRRAAAQLKTADVREIPYEQALPVILKNEWLGNAGSVLHWVGLFVRDPETGQQFLAGVEGFGSTAGTNVAPSVCGKEHADKVITITRGACEHWAHEHTASHFIPRACDLMRKRGYSVFVAFSDPSAGEVGTVYQASNFVYSGMTKPTEKYRTPDGKVHDGRMVSGLTRDRRGGGLRFKRTRAEQKAILESRGCVFFRGNAKHRYVFFAGSTTMKRKLRQVLKWPVLPYPKRHHADPSAPLRNPA